MGGGGLTFAWCVQRQAVPADRVLRLFEELLIIVGPTGALPCPSSAANAFLALAAAHPHDASPASGDRLLLLGDVLEGLAASPLRTQGLLGDGGWASGLRSGEAVVVVSLGRNGLALDRVPGGWRKVSIYSPILLSHVCFARRTPLSPCFMVRRSRDAGSHTFTLFTFPASLPSSLL